MPEIASPPIEVGVYESGKEISAESGFRLRQLTGFFLCIEALVWLTLGKSAVSGAV